MGGAEFPSFIPPLQGVRLWLTNSWLAARANGDGAPALNDSLRAVEFGFRILEAEPLLVEALVANSIIRIGAAHTVAAALLPGTGREALTAAAEKLGRLDRLETAMRTAIAGEARWGLFQFRGLLAGGEARRKCVLDLAIADQVLAEMLGDLPSTPKSGDDESEYDAVKRHWEKEMPDRIAAALRDAERVDWKRYLEAGAGLFRALRKADAGSIPAFKASYRPPDAADILRGTALEFMVKSRIGIETGDTYVNLIASGSASLRMSRMLLLLRLYEHRHQRLPAALDEMVPALCARVPLDPFDGQPLRYDAGKRLLWCVGLNLKDESGQAEPAVSDGKDDVAMSLP